MGRRAGLLPSTAAGLALSMLGAGAQAADIEVEISGRFSVESRWYPDSAQHSGQRSHASGFTAKPEFYAEDEEGRSLTISPFFRYDTADPRRTHADLREAFLLLYGELGNGEWELRLGVDRVSWGVAEVRNLVDIVNQTDLVEHPDEKTKLGQPMAHGTWSADWGSLELFLLPWHRERIYPGRAGRLRSRLVVDNDKATWDSAAEERHMDWAVRYSGSFGPVDLGLSYFDGQNREPSLRPVLGDVGGPVLQPHHEKIRQFGLDAQLTTGPGCSNWRPSGASAPATVPVWNTPSARKTTTAPGSPGANTPCIPSSTRTPKSPCWRSGTGMGGDRSARPTRLRTTCSSPPAWP